MAVDDRLGSGRVYRVVQIGLSDEDVPFLQVIRLDLIKGEIIDKLTDMTDHKLGCADQIKMNGDLIVVLCAKDHTLSFLLDSDG